MNMHNDKRIEDEDESIVKDGEGLRVPFFMMDSVQRTVSSTEAAKVLRDETFSDPYERYERKLGERWRSPSPSMPVAQSSPMPAAPASHGTSPVEAAYAAYEHRLTNAWRVAK